MRKNLMTLDDHRRTGEVLKIVRNGLRQHLSSRNFKKGSWCDKKLRSALNWLDKLRSKLDALVHEQFPRSEEPLTKIYYGGEPVTDKSLDELYRLFDDTHPINGQVLMLTGIPDSWKKVHDVLVTLQQHFPHHVKFDVKGKTVWQ